MSRLVYISANLPRAIPSHVHGLWQRQQLFIDALAPLFDEITCIFWRDLGPGDLGDTGAAAEKASAAFGRPVGVKLLQAAPLETQPGFLEFYGRSAVLGPHGHGYRRVIGRSEVAQLQSAVADDASLVFAQSLEVMATVARLRQAPGPVIWDANDLETLKYLRELGVAPWTKGKPLRYLAAIGLRNEERRAARRAALGFVCSGIDRERAQRAFGGRFVAIPNAVSLPPLAEAPLSAVPTLLFVGFMGYGPNRDAADWLVERIWPLVRRERPDAELLIAGARSGELRCHAAPPAGVRLLGFVPDLGGLYAGAHVVVCPVRSGSGTRVKLLEAGAYGKAIVSTRIGAEGIDLQDGVSAVFADDPASFAQACLALLREPARRIAMGGAARALVQQHYAREAVIERIRVLMPQVVGRTDV